jgi:tRNA 2-thiouridine synthesizing protein C
MIGNVFQSTVSLSPERLTWITDILKYYCTKLHPESLHHTPRIPTPPFYLFISGDALYSLVDRRCYRQWEILLSLPPVRCICSQRELRLRGLNVEPLKMKYPDQIMTVTDKPGAAIDPYWGTFLESAAKETRSIGILHLHSPYMFEASRYMVDLLDTAVDRNITPELYAYLDGVHVIHRDQSPTEFDNIGVSLNTLFSKAQDRGMDPVFLACGRCATTRGYSTFKTVKGKIVSACTIPSVKIRDLDRVVERFNRDHFIVSESSFSVQNHKETRYPRITPKKQSEPPPLVILVTQCPYGTETTSGAISFGIACAHRGIRTSIIFIEDGIYAITGRQVSHDSARFFNIQEIVDATGDMNDLEYYSYSPSFQQRGLVSTHGMRHVQPLDAHELAIILFHSPATVESSFQRVILF